MARQETHLLSMKQSYEARVLEETNVDLRKTYYKCTWKKCKYIMFEFVNRYIKHGWNIRKLRKLELIGR